LKKELSPDPVNPVGLHHEGRQEENASSPRPQLASSHGKLQGNGIAPNSTRENNCI
jgi:hypothetical protein